MWTWGWIWAWTNDDRQYQANICVEQMIYWPIGFVPSTITTHEQSCWNSCLEICSRLVVGVAIWAFAAGVIYCVTFMLMYLLLDYIICWYRNALFYMYVVFLLYKWYVLWSSWRIQCIDNCSVQWDYSPRHCHSTSKVVRLRILGVWSFDFYLPRGEEKRVRYTNPSSVWRQNGFK